MITVLGASGFIGSRVVRRLEALGREHQAVRRHDPLPTGSLGHVVYCIGLTADFRSRPFDTVEAHVCKLLDVLRRGDFESLLYLSSTRLYSESTSEETTIPVSPLDVYNASKITGESLVLNCGKPARVVRVSNVYGDDFNSNNFLSTIINNALTQHKIVLQTSADSAKDYISVDNVVDGLIAITTSGKERIYNLASGVNVSNHELAQMLGNLTGCRIEYSRPAPSVIFPPINIDRLRAEFDLQMSHMLDDMPQLIESYRRNLESSHDQS
jgi:nucleoside-diphosphate-sugar epimerase